MTDRAFGVQDAATQARLVERDVASGGIHILLAGGLHHQAVAVIVGWLDGDDVGPDDASAILDALELQDVSNATEAA